MAEELRPKPKGYKPSGRKFNMLEQTPEGLLFSHPGSSEYRKWYDRAADLFDAEGHHVVDLAYIDKLMYDDHLEKLQVVLSRLHNASLCLNAAKSSFVQGEIEYLGYVLTCEDIKPQPEKYGLY